MLMMFFLIFPRGQKSAAHPTHNRKVTFFVTIKQFLSILFD